MSYNKEDENEILLTYSFKSYLAAALYYFREGDVNYTVPRINWLAKRWNNEDSQANLYVSGGYGYERSFNETVGVGFGSVEADWESPDDEPPPQNKMFLRKLNEAASWPDMETDNLRSGFAP